MLIYFSYLGNILVPERSSASDDKIVFIDFEYCSYNFRFVLTSFNYFEFILNYMMSF